ncbi:hypothetical protein ACQCVB_20135 [Fictibacillus phosphorivorans]|uniref:hypothetical protein n=1 Tax=Fictibacillus phosphorivorans TaxID=1221500 RepID=UPI003CE9C32F
MSEVNAYMNGYQPDGDTEFLSASLEAHKKALKEYQRKVERLEQSIKVAREFLGEEDYGLAEITLDSALETEGKE